MADTTLLQENSNPAHESTHDEIWGRFKRFYSKNEKTLEKCINTDVKAIAKGEKVSDIEQQIDSFSETTKIVLDGLAELGKIHPIIGAAVVAFHAVISLDLTRRENDRKVITIMVEMQNMMCAMFQLRHLTHHHVHDNERDEEKSHLDRLVKSITDDITQCGSDINYYLSQKFVLRMAKAWNFEARFKTHVETFAVRRSELQTAITAYIAGGVDYANVTLTVVSTKMDGLESKLDVIFEALLRKLDTPSERETQEFFDANGGIKNCVAKDDLLVRLLALAGDVVPKTESGEKSEDKVTKSRRILQEELQKDFNESLRQNTLRFEKLLAVQNNNHERVIAHLEKQEGYQKVAVSKLDKLLFYMHPETKLNDPELRRIWEDMGLKTSVKAKNFVLTFRDHYQHEKSAPSSAYPKPATSARADGPQTLQVVTNFQGSLDTEDPNAWLLEYIDVAHVRPIVEAMDADGSGFISVKEVNMFARSKPNEWSFLQWMVYWAAGWHINILTYRDKIYDILIRMHELLPLIHPGNQRYVDRYLDCYVMGHIEAALRSTKDVGVDRQSPQLKELALFYADIQETALKTNLEEMSYIISSPADANLVVGAARVEAASIFLHVSTLLLSDATQWIYPLLYLLLNRHLAIMTLAKSHILHEYELTTHQTSLDNIFTVFLQRKDTIQAMFSQIYQNVGGRFETFAYGMFYAAYKEDTEISPAKSTLTKVRAKATRQNIILASRTKKEAEDIRPDLSILALGQISSFDFDLLSVHPPSDTIEGVMSNPLGGYWCGVCWDIDSDVFPEVGLLHFTLCVTSDGTVSGDGESYRGAMELSGHVSQRPSNDFLHDVDLKMSFGTDLLISFKGVYDVERDAMHGNWENGYNPPIPDATDAGTSAGIAQNSIGAVDDQEALPEQTHCTEGVPCQGVGSGDCSDKSDAEIDTDCGPTANANDKGSETMKDSEAPDEPEGDSYTQSLGSSRSPVRLNLPAEQVGSGVAGQEGQAEDNVPQAIDIEIDRRQNEVEESVVPDSGRFSFTRTSAEVFRYRAHLISTENESLSNGRRRWIFAIEAVRYQVQAKRFSWDHIRRKFAERKLWVSLTLKFCRGLLATGESDIVCRITGEYHPAEGRLYENLTGFLNERLYPYIVGRYPFCDHCGGDIVVNRFRCITCMKEDLSNEVDLCADKPACIASSTTNTQNNFVHVPSHTLLRSHYFIHDCDLAALIALCRTRSDDIKRKYRILEEGKKVTKRNAKSSKTGKATDAAQKDESLAVEPMICVCCMKRVSLPCWVCATCAVDTAICLDCERIQAAVKLSDGDDNSRLHSHGHLLLRIHDNKEIHPREVNNARLQQELSYITADLRSLEEKVTSHLRSATKVTRVLKALAESNPNVKLLGLEAGDTHGHDDNLSDIFTDIFSNTDGVLSAPLSPKPVVPSVLPVASEPPAEPATNSGMSAAPPGAQPDEKLIPNDTPGVVEEEAITVVNTEQPVMLLPPAHVPAGMRGRPQCLDTSSSSLINPAPSIASATEDSKPSDQLSGPPQTGGLGVGMKSKVLDARFDALDQRLSNLEKAVDVRFSGLESQIGKILTLLEEKL
ncbi:hypothetical protein D9619_010061 [Psilocybe cf. subviscida]|uniref:EF-hand domain-containing protein n=1 Tax=Psilocybe cf. subviscida TaxID=2480587 RepID=A0A8H5BMA8_9AGAR|nr:hypothetical protein D9619_010061 [Psilocybe cf. subviscida]